MSAPIRDFRTSDEPAVVALSLRAWAPVFDSMAEVLGHELSVRLHGEDWQVHQAGSVREVINDPAMQVWVILDHGDEVAGFAAAKIADPATRMGEVVMLAVDPASAGKGRGSALTEHATGWLREQGMLTAMISTGGDPGHAPARRTYEKADYTPMPVINYFKAL